MSVETFVHDVEIPISPYLALPIALKDGSAATVQELLARFETSHYASWMRTEQVLRFQENYGYEREAMLADLGEDVSPTGHHRTTLDQAIAVIERERQDGTLMGEISDEELAIALLAIGLHDTGECEHPELLLEPGVTRLVGDIPAGCKQPEDREAEAAVRHAVNHNLFSDVDPLVMSRVEAIIAHQDDTVLHYLFEGAHRATTLQTIINAKQTLRTLDEGKDNGHPVTPERRTALLALATQAGIRALGESARMVWYAHLNELHGEAAQTVTRHVATPGNEHYHRH